MSTPAAFLEARQEPTPTTAKEVIAARRQDASTIGYSIRDAERRQAFRAGYLLALEHVASDLGIR